MYTTSNQKSKVLTWKCSNCPVLKTTRESFPKRKLIFRYLVFIKSIATNSSVMDSS